ncbi:hypothetical protein [Mangrovimonas cancribranchiae]|uniref:Uncharacterized protein n=1 Tax=Mangrovimonas cancribranchiae TaxID=3080055 RepID=A0AAU6NZL7_9FLAO
MSNFDLSLLGFLKIQKNIDYDLLDLDNEKVIVKFALQEKSSEYRKYIFKNLDDKKKLKSGYVILLVAIVGIFLWSYLITIYELTIINIIIGLVAIVASFFIGSAWGVINDLHFAKSLIFSDTNIIFKTIIRATKKYPIKKIFIRVIDSETYIYFQSYNYIIYFKSSFPEQLVHEFFCKISLENKIEIDG